MFELPSVSKCLFNLLILIVVFPYFILIITLKRQFFVLLMLFLLNFIVLSKTILDALPKVILGMTWDKYVR